MEKKNTGLIVLVVILLLVVLGLGGFIVYDKVLEEDNKVINCNSQNILESNNESTSKIDNDTALQLVQFLHDEAIDVYYISNKFESDKYCKGNIANCMADVSLNEYIKITNYYEVMNNIFTSNGINQFEKDSYFVNRLKKENNEVYISGGNIDSDAGFGFANLKIKSIEENIITASIDIVEAPSNKISTKEIIIKKENNKWLVEKFATRNPNH